MRWIGLLGLAVVLAGAGWFFTTLDLGHADQIASVLSFLLALAVAGLAMVDRFARRPPAHAAVLESASSDAAESTSVEPRSAAPETARREGRIVGKADVASLGDHATINYTKHVKH
jgi:hypothetical protein